MAVQAKNRQRLLYRDKWYIWAEVAYDGTVICF